MEFIGLSFSSFGWRGRRWRRLRFHICKFSGEIVNNLCVFWRWLLPLGIHIWARSLSLWSPPSVGSSCVSSGAGIPVESLSISAKTRDWGWLVPVHRCRFFKVLGKGRIDRHRRRQLTRIGLSGNSESAKTPLGSSGGDCSEPRRAPASSSDDEFDGMGATAVLPFGYRQFPVEPPLPFSFSVILKRSYSVFASEKKMFLSTKFSPSSPRDCRPSFSFSKVRASA